MNHSQDQHDAAWLKAYQPTLNGVHVFDPDDTEFGGVTVANFSGTDLTTFIALSSEPDCAESDLVCDLYAEGDLIDSIGIRRQDLALIQRQLSA